MKLLLTGAVCGVFNGLLGSGGGVVAVIGLRKLGLDTHKSHATALAVMLPLTIVSAVIYLVMYETHVPTAVWITAGGIAGGIIGAKLLSKISAAWLHKIFGAMMIFAAIRMIL